MRYFLHNDPSISPEEAQVRHNQRSVIIDGIGVGIVTGIALNLEEDQIGAVVLGDADHIEEGQTVKATGRILSVPVGDALLEIVAHASS